MDEEGQLRMICDEAMAKAVEICSLHKAAILDLANDLLKVESLDSDQIEAVMVRNEVPFGEPLGTKQKFLEILSDNGLEPPAPDSI